MEWPFHHQSFLLLLQPMTKERLPQEQLFQIQIPLPIGYYDIIVDYDSDGTYTAGLDAIWGVAGPGFYVVATGTAQIKLYY